MSCNATRPEDGRVLLHPQVLCVNAHDQLNEAGQSQQKEDGGKCHMVGKVDSLALVALELNLTVARAILALPVARAVGVAAVLILRVHLTHGFPGRGQQMTTHRRKGT